MFAHVLSVFPGKHRFGNYKSTHGAEVLPEKLTVIRLVKSWTEKKKVKAEDA
jgi:hypothetical protein